MLPLQQAQELQTAISEYLKATFPFREKDVDSAFHRFVNDPDDGLFKGPYVSLQLPFRKAPSSRVIPLEIKPGFTPFIHQAKAFDRLSTENGQPLPTLLTTGTGSGKTESFLYPILDYCYKNRDRKGIKAIILYPMNALATDQAQRLGEMIWNDERLRGTVTAGLFIGEGKNPQMHKTTMGERNIIESRDRILDTVPDILLTNFKMLDFGLMKNRYHTLWEYNFANRELLKFLVLDELHTYDGAQGTDVANLIRRLKLKLQIERGALCPVGTSATIGKGPESAELLVRYASAVFGEDLTVDSVLTEERLDWKDFLEGKEPVNESVPVVPGIMKSLLAEDDEYESWLRKQKKLWGMASDATPYETGQHLRDLIIFRDLLKVCSGNLMQPEVIQDRLAALNNDYKKLPERSQDLGFSPRRHVLESLLTLISFASSQQDKKWPFLAVRVQLWIRELSGILRFVNEEPEFTWRNANREDERKRAALPMYFCRDCGASGWLGKKADNQGRFSDDPAEIFRDYFQNHKNLYFINTDKPEHEPLRECNFTTVEKGFLGIEKLELTYEPGDRRTPVFALRKIREGGRAEHICPECATTNSVSVIGARVASLSSVAISQTLSSNLDVRDDRFRKILAFSNSVQDAAHRSGFIEARNYRFMFRTSVQQVVNTLEERTDLKQLFERFQEHWLDQLPQKSDWFYRFYPKDCDLKAPIESYKTNPNADAFTDDFVREFDLRIYWEILSEYGYNALIGRTLEKTGSSTVTIPKYLIDRVYPTMRPWMQENLMESVQEADLASFLAGILYRLRVRGGIDHPYFSKYRGEDLKLWSLNWLKDSRHFLNRRYHPLSRFPKLLTTVVHQQGLLDTTHTNQQNWHHLYFRKSFPLVPDNNKVTNEFYTLLLDELVGSEIVNRSTVNGINNYALLPESLVVSNEIMVRECDTCGHKLAMAASDRYMAGSKCQQYRCTGSYTRVVETDYTYYNKIFNRSHAPRVRSREHTGILDRSVREKVEHYFKRTDSEQAYNTLVATSTLEMGIDIGNLDAAFNLGLPPLPSNYLQRIGRAGRSSGSSLVANFSSSGDPHDMFYFESPREMMEGDIHTPGCFLNAPEILRRQFLAHCIDLWVYTDPARNIIPSFVKLLRLETTDLRDEGFFMNQLLGFIISRKKEILENMSRIYEPDLEPEQLRLIGSEIDGGDFGTWLIYPFTALKDRFRHISEQRKSIEKEIKDRNLGVKDPERQQLESDMKSLFRMMNVIKKQQTIEFMTMSGLLPNYAFPERGVQLSGRVFQPAAVGGTSSPESIEKEYVRPAAQAIRELAPHNVFYAEGFKFPVTGILTHEWGGEYSTLERRRFCSNCDHMELAGEGNYNACPKCGDLSFGSATNVHAYARLTGVRSEVIRDRAALDDSSDDRDTEQYRISRHITINESNLGSLALVDIPFGIEFAPSVDIMISNLGLKDTQAVDRVTITGDETIPRHGFVTCRQCGFSTGRPALAVNQRGQNAGGGFHYPYCRNRQHVYEGSPNHVFEEVFLIRTQHTEALKILLPTQEFATEEFVELFKAGLELGLRDFYQGNPSHLGFYDYREYNKVTCKFDQYLLLYDKVPGGTGYLKKLYDKDVFTRILKNAYERIRNCNCQHTGKDGCYHCVFTYGNQYKSEVLSRSNAEKTFEKILKHTSTWQELDHSLSNVTRTGKIEESELEDLFILSLENWAEKNKCSFEKKQGGMNRNYRLIVPMTNNLSMEYLIRPQVLLGAADGIRSSLRADFVIYPVRLHGAGEEDHLAYKSIVVELDGYQYHASAEHNRFAKDLEKRLAIRKSERFDIWTLTWDDVVIFRKRLENGNSSDMDQFSPSDPAYADSRRMVAQLPHWPVFNPVSGQFTDSMSRLLAILQLPDAHRETAMGLAALQCMRNFPAPNIHRNELNEYLNSENSIKPDQRVPNNELGSAMLYTDWSVSNNLFSSKVFAGLNGADMFASVRLNSNGLDSIDREEWNEFWRLWNLLLFTANPDVYRQKIEDSAYSTGNERDEILRWYSPEMHGLINRLLDSGTEFDREGGHTLQSDNGIAAEAELGFDRIRVVFMPLCEVSRKEYIRQGYEIADPETFNIDRIKS